MLNPISIAQLSYRKRKNDRTRQKPKNLSTPGAFVRGGSQNSNEPESHKKRMRRPETGSVLKWGGSTRGGGESTVQGGDYGIMQKWET